MRQTLGKTLRLIRADIEWRCVYERKPVSLLTGFRLVFHPGVATILLFRWQRFYDDHHLRVLGSICRWLNLLLFTSAYSSRAQIAGGFLVVHAVANFVDDDVIIGTRCVFYSQNSLSRSPFADRAGAPDYSVPVVDSDVIFGMGACAHGGIRIAKLCRLGMNTVVDSDTTPNSILFGIPARVTGRRTQEMES